MIKYLYKINLQGLRNFLQHLVISDFLVELGQFFVVRLLNVLEGWLHPLQHLLEVIASFFAQ